MPHDVIPRDPVYMTYITNHNQDYGHASPLRSSSPFRPTTGLTYTDFQLQSSRGVYQHFHRPFNDHSRFLAAASPEERAALRDVPRLAPPPWDGSTPDHDVSSSRPHRQRPSSAPSGGRRRDGSQGSGGGGGGGGAQRPSTAINTGTATLLDNMTTRTGAPCYTVSSLIEADLVSGSPVVDPGADFGGEETWRVARVQTYQVPPSRVGYGEGAVRPFHQDYRHYKYFGFAGHGAKTSWAHNPKYARTYGHIFTSSRDSASPVAAADAPPPEPLQGVVGGPRRSLTAAERRLVAQFSAHNYGAEGQPSDPRVAEVLQDLAAGRQPSSDTLRDLERKAARYRDSSGSGRGPAVTRPRTPNVLARSQAPGPPRGQAGGGGGPAQVLEVIESFNTKVDLELRAPLAHGNAGSGSGSRAGADPGSGSSPGASPGGGGGGSTARVTTYRQLPSDYAGELNRSPNHGSQSPWHQRYGHYKYSGFAGKGATSSWARNPKYAKLYD